MSTSDGGKMKRGFLLVLVFASFFLLLSILFLNSYSKIKLFFDEIPAFIPPILITIAVLLSGLFIFLISRDFAKENRFSWFVKNHFTGILLFVAFLNICVGSISDKVIMDFNKSSDLIGVAWTIYAISIGAFAVWHTLVFMRVINSNKGKYTNNETEDADEYDRRRTLIYKSLDHINIASSFEPVIYICFNTLLNIIATSVLYFSKEYQLVQEIFVICSFVFTINTLLDVLFSIVFQLYKERKALLKETEVNYLELSSIEEYIKAKEYMEQMEELDKNEPLTHSKYNDKKKRVIIERTIFFLEKYKKDKKIIERDYKEIASLSDSYNSVFDKKKSKR